VRAAEDALERTQSAGELHLEPGERIEWTGQSQLMAAGQRRLMWIAPIMGIAMLGLGLLFLQFRSLTEALIVLAAVPLRDRRELLDALLAPLPHLGAGLGGAALHDRPGDADRGGDGRSGDRARGSGALGSWTA
jgi:hypothetical protein